MKFEIIEVGGSRLLQQLPEIPNLTPAIGEGVVISSELFVVTQRQFDYSAIKEGGYGFTKLTIWVQKV